jgi:hypothetical protein
MGWRSQLLWPNLSGLKLKFQPENSKAPSVDPILQSQTTGIWIQRIDPPYYTGEPLTGHMQILKAYKITFPKIHLLLITMSVTLQCVNEFLRK